MPIRRDPIDIIPSLKNRVDEIIKHNPAEDLPKIRNSLQELEHFFPNFKHCEESLNIRIKSLEFDIYDQILDDITPKDKIQDKLKLIYEKIESIKSFVSKIQLPPPEESASALQQQQRTQSGAAAWAQAWNQSEDWQRLDVEENIQDSPAIANLQLSYDILDIKLKLCLLCIAAFPQNVVIKKKPLIFWWIGEGLITKSKQKTAEEVGEGIFRDLVKEGMIQQCQKTQKNPTVDSCKVHPWIRRMLISVARRAEFFDIDKKGKFEDDYSKSRRACLLLGDEGFSGNNPGKEEELLTLFNVTEQYLSFKPEFFLKFKKLMILQLGRWQTSAKHHIEVENEQFLEELHVQKHLKYLSLHGLSRVTHLPSSIVGCSSLEILDLRACHNLEKLPSDIGSFVKLTHLDVSECYLLESMPKGIEKLSSLQVLKGFVIGQSRKNHCKLSDLAQLKKLRKLSMHIRSEAFIEAVELEKLKEFENLRILTMSWGGVTLPSKPKLNTNAGASSVPPPQLTRATTMIMESSSIPPNLEKLDLRYFPRKVAPNWLSWTNLRKLKRLYIRGGELQRWAMESSLDSPPNWKLTILRVKYLRNVMLDGHVLVKLFPGLKYFEKVNCHQIAESKYETDVEWNEIEGLEQLRNRLDPFMNGFTFQCDCHFGSLRQ